MVDDFTLSSLTDEGLLQFFDVPGRRQRSAVVVGALIRAVEPLARGADEQGEQQFLFVVAGEFLVDLVAQVGFQDFAVAVAQKGVLADGAREHAFVHAENEQSARNDRPRAAVAPSTMTPSRLRRSSVTVVRSSQCSKGMAEIVEADAVIDLIETGELVQDFENRSVGLRIHARRCRFDIGECQDIFPARPSMPRVFLP